MAPYKHGVVAPQVACSCMTVAGRTQWLDLVSHCLHKETEAVAKFYRMGSGVELSLSGSCLSGPPIIRIGLAPRLNLPRNLQH